MTTNDTTPRTIAEALCVASQAEVNRWGRIERDRLALGAAITPSERRMQANARMTANADRARLSVKTPVITSADLAEFRAAYDFNDPLVNEMHACDWGLVQCTWGHAEAVFVDAMHKATRLSTQMMRLRNVRRDHFQG